MIRGISVVEQKSLWLGLLAIVSQESREVGNIGVDQSELLHNGHIPKHLYPPGRLYFMIV